MTFYVMVNYEFVTHIITAIHSQKITWEVKDHVTTVGKKLSVLAGFIANLTLADSVNIDLCGWYSSNTTCLFLLVQYSGIRSFTRNMH